MDPEKARLISNLIDKIPIVIPLLFTTAVSVVTLIVGYKTGKWQSSLNLITSKRIEWQETIRNELAEFLKDSYFIYSNLFSQIEKNTDNTEFDLITISKAVAEGNRLILRLNPVDDAKIIASIKEVIDFNLPETSEEVPDYYNKMDSLLTKLIDEAHVMLKKEWEKIKLEAGHKRRRWLPN
jgi:hypothetical protein